MTTSAKADAIRRALTRDRASKQQRIAATEVAEAQLVPRRIRAVGAELTAMVDVASGNLEQLQRLAALARYERFAHTKRRRASRKL